MKNTTSRFLSALSLALLFVVLMIVPDVRAGELDTLKESFPSLEGPADTITLPAVTDMHKSYLWWVKSITPANKASTVSRVRQQLESDEQKWLRSTKSGSFTSSDFKAAEFNLRFAKRKIRPLLAKIEAAKD